ncbi:MAG: hypothetical protein CW716_10190 [Candidatus Bathyarchaeum sp.]|nr:MAG: hypothetical protein CW716_10190 [Candidatus Bathyarchaeum sp.]
MKKKPEPKMHNKDTDDGQLAVPNKQQLASTENGIYGSRWKTIHNRYFSDPEVAFPLIEVIKKAVLTTRPQTIADLGGGTGFLLEELLKQPELSKTTRLVNVDRSPLQLSENRNHRIIHIQTSIDKITRNQLQPNENGLMLVSRSLLHYFGEADLTPLLKHIRSQMKTGEFFIHQSACFQNARDAACLNLLYKLMSTQKWFTTIDALKSILAETGFHVYAICPATKIQLDSADLTERYHLKPKQRTLIKKQIEQQYGQKPQVYTCSPDHFTAWLHYNIFSCKAI